MSKINILALGGLEENGKNTYIVEVDNRIFIIDCGLKHPSMELHGVDYIEPNLNYLYENQSRINGLFLSHGHDEHIGAAPTLLKKLNIPIFGSNFTLAVLKDLMLENNLNLDKYKFYSVTPKSQLKFGEVKVKFFNTNHSIPESLGIALTTDDGNIVYTGNYNFDQNGGQQYFTSFDKIINIAKEGVLALLPESIGASENIHRETIQEFNFRVTNTIKNAPSRVIISLYSSNLQRIQQIINIAIQYQKKIAIIGRRTQRFVNIAMNLGYLAIPANSLINLRFIDEKNLNNNKDLVILVTGERHEPFFMLQRMCWKIDRLVQIEPSDTILLLTKPFSGTEKIASKTIDSLTRINDNVVFLPEKLLFPENASREETKMMINLLKPKFIFPLIGEYRHLYSLFEVAKSVGYNRDNVFMLENGKIAKLDSGCYLGMEDEVEVGEILIDGKGSLDINDSILRDRELLGTSGLVLLISHVSPKQKRVISTTEVVSKGFVYQNSEEEMKESIRKIFQKVSEKHFETRINWNEYKLELRHEVGNYIYEQTKQTPIIIPVVISVDVGALYEQ